MVSTKDIKAIEKLSFEESLSELEELSAKMSQGGQPLEESIDMYARGVALSKHCQALLAKAQARIQKLDGELQDITQEDLKVSN